MSREILSPRAPPLSPLLVASVRAVHLRIGLWCALFWADEWHAWEVSLVACHISRQDGKPGDLRMGANEKIRQRRSF